ncbi:MAG: hypothetical protein ACYTAS_04810 [Planctomycetota bacterium]|jgi:hypothetical protein
MRNEFSSAKESIDFTCPCCGACAFTIAETDRLAGDTGEDDGPRVVVMKCLNCLEFYRYRLGSDVAEVVLAAPEASSMDSV